RELGQMTTFDLVLLLVLANAVQNSINAGDNSLGGGLISAVTLLVINFAVGEATYRWRWFERLVQGRPLPLVRQGKVVLRNMKRERVTLEELRSALRKQGIDGVTQCKHAVLESDGTLTAVRNDVTQHELGELVER
ncbi:MAG TPA: YetF domain-containing protein, partial [Polyangia bacterium]